MIVTARRLLAVWGMSTDARRPPLFDKAEAGTKSFWGELKGFALKGNVVDLAVAVVIGGAFGKIVSALVADVIMPVVALALPSGDWRAHGVVLRHAADPKNDVILKWGDLIGAVLDFAIVTRKRCANCGGGASRDHVNPSSWSATSYLRATPRTSK